MHDIFERNRDLWSHSHPKEAIWLQYLEWDRMEVICQEEGKGSLLAEAREWFSSLQLEGAELLIVFGIGLGAYFTPLKRWLGKDRRRYVVFLEDDLEAIYAFFHTAQASDFLTHPQAGLYYFRELGDLKAVATHLFWSFPRSQPAFSALKYYEREKKEIYDEIRRQITYDFGVKNSLLDEYLEFGVVFFRNYYQNIQKIGEAYLGNALFGKFHDVPAIICGAGPSLESDLPLLKTLTDKALIFAGSSSINALTSHEVLPHLGAGIDPNPMQEVRLKSAKSLQFPFLYRNRLYPEALDAVQGKKLFITGAGGYDIAAYFEQAFGITGEPIEEGRNVVNFCLEAAHKMGCNPIIFVGMDLAFSREKEYCPGVVEHLNTIDVKRWNPTSFDDTLVKRQDIKGNDVFTLWKWIAEADWIGDFAKNHPEVTIINATGGGIGFPGIPHKTLQEAAGQYFTGHLPLVDRIDGCIEQHALSFITQEKITEAFAVLKNSLETCIDYLAKLEEENEKVKSELKKKKKVASIQTGKAALYESELAEEPAFIYVLQIFNEVASRMMQRDILHLMDPGNHTSESLKEMAKLDLNKQKYRFLLQAAKVNLAILQKAAIS